MKQPVAQTTSRQLYSLAQPGAATHKQHPVIIVFFDHKTHASANAYTRTHYGPQQLFTGAERECELMCLHLMSLRPCAF